MPRSTLSQKPSRKPLPRAILAKDDAGPDPFGLPPLRPSVPADPEQPARGPGVGEHGR